MTDKMREAFEKWYLMQPIAHKSHIVRISNGHYFGAHTETAWQAWQAAQSEQSVPVVGEADCYDAGLLSDFGGGNVEWWQDYIRAELARAHEFYVSQMPTHSITAAELERLRKDAAKVLNSEQIRIAAVAAVRAVTGCPDIKGKDGAYLVDEIIARLIEMQNDAAIAAEGEK